jgi:hypothetical protein
MLGIESKIADAQWNQMYAPLPPHPPPSRLASPPKPKAKGKKITQKEMHKNCSLVMESNVPLSPSPQNQRGIKNNF